MCDLSHSCSRAAAGADGPDTAQHGMCTMLLLFLQLMLLQADHGITKETLHKLLTAGHCFSGLVHASSWHSHHMLVYNRHKRLVVVSVLLWQGGHAVPRA